MNYYFLDKVSWQYSQALYHAAAYLQQEAFFILRPSMPYVCIGYHQDAEQEIDLQFTRKNNIPVFRRELGGGSTYLDGDQLFYQLILRKNRPETPESKDEFYRKFLTPVVETYREFGVPAEYKPVNDITANGRKVSGTGAGEINGMVILVGNFILDFNYEMMSKCLRVPDEKFRDKVFKTLQENLSSFLRETGEMPETRLLGDSLARRYEALLGVMDWKTSLEGQLISKADELLIERNTDQWLFANDRRRPDVQQVKIRDGVYVIQNILKTPGGIIRVTAVNEEGILHDIHFSGDFFFYPFKKLTLLEEALEGVAYNTESVTQTISRFYEQESIESPGVNPSDFARGVVPPEY